MEQVVGKWECVASEAMAWMGCFAMAWLASKGRYIARLAWQLQEPACHTAAVVGQNYWAGYAS